MKTLLGLLALLHLFSCTNSLEKRIVLDVEKDLIPEGIAIDPRYEMVYLSSLKKNKIVKYDLREGTSSDFIKSGQFDYLPGFGMLIKGDTLFALGNSLPKLNNRSILLLLNLRTQELITSYKLNDASFIYLNDIAVSKAHDIFITDSESNKVYTVNKPKGELEVFLEDDEIAHPNGIALSENDQYLYLATYKKGIRVVDIASKRIVNKVNPYSGIDGLKYYNRHLYGIVNAKRNTDEMGLFRYTLSEKGDAVIEAEKIIPYGENFKLPTTFDIYDDHLYFVINSQLENFDQKNNEIMDTTKLEPYVLLKKKISDF